MTTFFKKRGEICVEAPDAKYTAEFMLIFERGKSWEFDSMSDSNMDVERDTGKVQIMFRPDERTMKFPEDANRKREYRMKIEHAREVYKIIRENPNYWFALDTANFYAKK